MNEKQKSILIDLIEEIKNELIGVDYDSIKQDKHLKKLQDRLEMLESILINLMND